jgi:hypothetical protein
MPARDVDRIAILGIWTGSRDPSFATRYACQQQRRFTLRVPAPSSLHACQLNCLSSKPGAGHKQPHAAGFSMIKFPSSSTLSPVFLASSSTEGCQSTLPASGPPMIAIRSASGASVRLLKPR